MKHPKFEQKIRKNVVTPVMAQDSEPGYGIVLSYNAENNTAAVLMARPGSDQPGEIFTGVSCPTSMGLQLVAPEPGRPCWIVFRDGTQSAPMITHFFNYNFQDTDFERQYKTKNTIPRFMTEL